MAFAGRGGRLGGQVTAEDPAAHLVKRRGRQHADRRLGFRTCAGFDAHFDHAFSIRGLWSADFNRTQGALREIARCLRPGGLLALTFEYRSPVPAAVSAGTCLPSPLTLTSEADIHRRFLKSGGFRLAGTPLFQDNWRSYLRHPADARKSHTLGAIILQRLGTGPRS